MENLKRFAAYATALTMGVVAASSANAEVGSKLVTQESTFLPIALDIDAENDNLEAYISFNDAVEDGFNAMMQYGEWEGNLKREIECAIYINGYHLIKGDTVAKLRSLGIIFEDDQKNKDMLLNLVNRIFYHNQMPLLTANNAQELKKIDFIDPTMFIYSETGKEVSESIFNNLFDAMKEIKIGIKYGKNCSIVITEIPDMSSVLQDSNSAFSTAYRQLTTAAANEPNVYGVSPTERSFINKTQGALLLKSIEEFLSIYSIKYPKAVGKHFDISANGIVTLKKAPKNNRAQRKGKLTPEEIVEDLACKWLSLYESVYKYSDNEVETELNGCNTNRGNSYIFDDDSNTMYVVRNTQFVKSNKLKRRA